MTVTNDASAPKGPVWRHQGYNKTAPARYILPRLADLYAHVRGMNPLTNAKERFLLAMSELRGLQNRFASAEAVLRGSQYRAARLFGISVELAYADFGGNPVFDKGKATFAYGVCVFCLLFRFGPKVAARLKSPRRGGYFVRIVAS